MVQRQYRYEVRGIGDFPWDMLRYDAVWPLTDPSPSRYEDWDNEAWTKTRTVLVQGAGCTPDRWSSFMWPVVDPKRLEEV